MAITLPKQKNLYIYNKHHQLVKKEKLNFYFFGSSSKGNSVYFEDMKIIIDLGFPMKRYTEVSNVFFYGVNTILLTHEHTDHLNIATLFKILDVYPHIKFIISKRMYNRLIGPMYATNMPKDKKTRDAMKDKLKTIYRSRFIQIEADKEPVHLYTDKSNIDGVSVIPHIVTHGDITNVAYEIKTEKNHILYSSDLDHVFAPEESHDPTIQAGLNLPLNYDAKGHVIPLDDPFDIIFLEANYDRDLLERVLREEPDNAHAQGNLRHISEQEAWQYIKFSLSDNGIFIPLHASASYGTLIQNLS